MKKLTVILSVLLTLCVCGAAFADGEWTVLEAEFKDNEPIACELVAPQFENEENKAVLGDVSEDDYVIGPENAVMTLIEYADFQCPYCSSAGLLALEFQKAHPDEVRYVYRHFPLSFHEKAPMAAYAADAAGKQGLFFEAEEFLYEKQNDWTDLESLDAFDAWLRENIAAGIEGLDFDQWVTDYESEEIRADVDGAFDKVAATGLVGGTPTFFANFYEVGNYMDLESYLGVLNNQRDYYGVCPTVAVEEGKEYRAVLDTTEGEIIINLFADKAPNLVSNFIELAQGGRYEGCSFRNVVEGFTAQTGDKSNTGTAIAGYTLADENLNSDAFNEPGAVFMANSGADTNSQQFVITQDAAEYFRKTYSESDPSMDEETLNAKVASKLETLNANYSVFGRVDEASLETVAKITDSTVLNSVVIEYK